MNGSPAGDAYISRTEEDEIKEQLDVVRGNHESRAVLLYGDGGIGKTSLVRHMAAVGTGDDTVWLEPVDVDDPEIWLLSNLERAVAAQLDPDNRYFADYRQQLSRLPSPTRSDISHETIISHLGRLRGVFAECYDDYVTREQKTVVVVFDTVEAIRGTNLARTLTQWMKTLPGNTLFILSGRPPSSDSGAPRDQLRAELDSKYRNMSVDTITIGGFSRDHTRDYIRASDISRRLIDGEGEALVLLSRGHPLWLAFLLDYLRKQGVPPEATRQSLAEMEADLPFDEAITDDRRMSPRGKRLHEDFLRRLVSPYQEGDFWHEAINRLAVVRQPVAKNVWQRLMHDRELPDGLSSFDEAWDELLNRSWIRSRANGGYLTLHDAVAEEFARRLFPLHDRDQRWRHGIWRQALGIYRDLAAEAQPEVERLRSALDEGLAEVEGAGPADDAEAARDEADLMAQSVALDTLQRRLDQLRAASLYYVFLSDFAEGSRELLDYYKDARQRHDSFFQDLLVLYLDRFLPGRASSRAFNDVIALKLNEFRDWLNGTGREFYVALGLMVGRYLVDSSQPDDALEFLAGLPEGAASAQQRHELYILRGNACLRASGKVKEAISYFEHAISYAEAPDTPNRNKLIAEAYKERGFYYRNIGIWDEADLSYRHAWETIVNSMATDPSEQGRKELASIQTNWAYIKALEGKYREGILLAETAAGIRHRMRLFADEGLSQSVCGEVHRYARRFEIAWRSYAQAERLLLEGRPYWDRLGFVYQEQAICLHQAAQEGIEFVANPRAEAERLIRRALELCLAYAIRAYPSALNRAGRIFGATDADAGLKYLAEGISEAQRLSDGWFWFANLVEYAEMSYRQWRKTDEPQYLTNIEERATELDAVADVYSFPDLKGRWSLLKGHLAVQEYKDSDDADRLDEAIAHYEKGFADLATRHVASYGAASINAEFEEFEKIFTDLPATVKAAWEARLRFAWTTAGEASLLLLAHLEELVIRPAG